MRVVCGFRPSCRAAAGIMIFGCRLPIWLRSVLFLFRRRWHPPGRTLPHTDQDPAMVCLPLGYRRLAPSARRRRRMRSFWTIRSSRRPRHDEVGPVVDAGGPADRHGCGSRAAAARSPADPSNRARGAVSAPGARENREIVEVRWPGACRCRRSQAPTRRAAAWGLGRSAFFFGSRLPAARIRPARPASMTMSAASEGENHWARAGRARGTS